MILPKPKIKELQSLLGTNREKTDRISRLYKALGDPTRFKIVFMISHNKKLCPSSAAAILNVTPSAISHQLRILEYVGIIEGTRSGKAICYALTKTGQRLVNGI